MFLDIEDDFSRVRLTQTHRVVNPRRVWYITTESPRFVIVVLGATSRPSSLVFTTAFDEYTMQIVAREIAEGLQGHAELGIEGETAAT